MTALIFGSPEANAIAAKNKELEREALAVESGPRRKLTPEERERFEAIAAEILLQDYEEKAQEDAMALDDEDLLDMMDGTVLQEEAEIILEARF